MSYVFSKALTERDVDERLKKQLPVRNKVPPPISSKPELGDDGKLKKEVPVTNNIKPPLPVKPKTNKTSQAPPVKRKPLSKSLSVDSYSTSKHTELDLTQIGDSEWSDFVLKRKEERDSEDAEEERIATIQSLNLHRKSLNGVEQIIVEDQVLNTIPLNHTEYIEDPSVPTFVDAEGKQSETPNDDVFSKEQPNTKLPELKIENVTDVLDGECKKVTESNGINAVEIKDKELNTENNAGNTSPVAITLPKPRQIISEIKRKSYSTHRSTTLPATPLTPQIRRGSDILKDADAQTPYFCRLSRGSIDLQDTLGLSDLKLKEAPGSVSDDKSGT